MNEDLRKRLITAGVLAGIMLICGLLAALTARGWFSLTIVIFLFCGLSAYEYAMVARRSWGRSPLRLCYFLLPLVPLVVMLYVLSSPRGPEGRTIEFYEALSTAAGAFFFSNLIGILAIVAAGNSSLAEAERISRDLFLGILLIGFCGAMLMALTVVDQSYAVLLWLILTVCVNDSAAYAVGKRVGGPRLAPVLSPNKTISGSIGGFVGGILVGCAGAALLQRPPSYGSAALLAAVVTAAAQLGDLTKSYFKRLHGAKDSGSLLPGHGGVLDRIDGILMAAPVVCLWLLQGVWLR